MNFDVLGVALIITGGVLIGAAIRDQNPKDLVLEAFDFSANRKQGNVPTWADKKAAKAAQEAGKAATQAGENAADIASEAYQQPIINYPMTSV